MYACASLPIEISISGHSSSEEKRHEEFSAKRPRTEAAMDYDKPLSKRPRQNTRSIDYRESSDNSPRGKKIESGSNFSDELFDEDDIDIDTVSKEALKDFLEQQSAKMMNICQKPDHPEYMLLSDMDRLLLDENALLKEKVAAKQKINDRFNERIAELNNEIDQKLKNILDEIEEEYKNDMLKHKLEVAELLPVHIEHLKQSPIELSFDDRTRVEDVAKKIQVHLEKLSSGANSLRSLHAHHARLGTYKHLYCQHMLQGVIESGKFEGINSLQIETAYHGNSVSQIEQISDIYWRTGGIVFDYKFGENRITSHDRLISALVLPHYAHSFQVTPKSAGVSDSKPQKKEKNA